MQARVCTRVVGIVALPALLLVAAACSSNNNKNQNAGGSSNPVPQTTLNPGAATPLGASGAPGSSPRPGGGATVGTAVASPGALAAAGAQTIALTATDSDTSGTNSKFSETSLTAKANQDIALTLANKGQAVHNWHLLNATDANGKEIKTDLLDPGKSATIDFKLTKPGTYNFQCDVHPTTMKGTLTIN